MKISIPMESGEVSQHFGHTPEFAIITVENGKIVSRETLKNPGHEPGLIPKLMSQNGVNVVITGGVGRKAVDLFDEMNITVIPGVSGTVEEALKGYLAGKLVTGKNLCDH